MATITLGQIYRAIKNKWKVTAIESLTVSTAVATLTPGTYGTRERAMIVVETSPVRFWCDGSGPSATVGIYAAPGAVISLTSNTDIGNFRAIRDTTATADAVLRVQYSEPDTVTGG